MLMMSDLERLRGCELPPIPWGTRLQSCLPSWLGGAPLHELVVTSNVFADHRDLMEWLFVRLLRSAVQGRADRCESLLRTIRQLRFRLRASGQTEHFRPAVGEALSTLFAHHMALWQQADPPPPRG